MIGLISNPRSGHNRRRLPALAGQLKSVPDLTHIVTDSVDDIAGALRELRDRGCECLAINGGDGTLAATLGCALEQAIFDELPPVALLPAGTANMTAGDVGVRGSLPRAVRKLCRWRRGQLAARRERRSLMRVSCGGAPRYGMFLGAGAIIQGTEYAHREIHSRGLRDDFSVGLGAVRTVWGIARGEPAFREFPELELRLPEAGRHSRHTAMLLAVSTLRRLFLGLDPFWGREPGPLRLTVIDADCQRFLRTFQAIARGRAGRFARPEHGYHSCNSARIELRMRGRLNLDGEMLTASPASGPVRISGSEPLTFLRL